MPEPAVTPSRSAEIPEYSPRTNWSLGAVPKNPTSVEDTRLEDPEIIGDSPGINLSPEFQKVLVEKGLDAVDGGTQKRQPPARGGSSSPHRIRMVATVEESSPGAADKVQPGVSKVPETPPMETKSCQGSGRHPEPKQVHHRGEVVPCEVQLKRVETNSGDVLNKGNGAKQSDEMKAFERKDRDRSPRKDRDRSPKKDRDRPARNDRERSPQKIRDRSPRNDRDRPNVKTAEKPSDVDRQRFEGRRRSKSPRQRRISPQTEGIAGNAKKPIAGTTSRGTLSNSGSNSNGSCSNGVLLVRGTDELAVRPPGSLLDQTASGAKHRGSSSKNPMWKLKRTTGMTARP